MEIFTNSQKGYPSPFIHHLIRCFLTLPAKTYPQFFPLQFQKIQNLNFLTNTEKLFLILIKTLDIIKPTESNFNK
ncbi:MAG: hypothetical protein DWB56_06110 [Candidatus Jettenia sp.]|nr:hypothetical protein [Candidatus Jettenia sp.]